MRISALLLLLIISSAQAQVLVFVSSSMPIISVAQWMAEARMQKHTALIMNGLVNDSLADTKAWVGKVIQASGGEGGVSIDPSLFKKYHIQAVPAVVNQHKVVYGNVTLRTALAELNNNANELNNSDAENNNE